MSEKISGIITDFLLRKNVIKEEEKEIYYYGYETLIYSIWQMLLLLVLGMIMNRIVSTVIFLMVFVSMRKYTGGYHAETRMGCTFMTVVCYVTVLVMTGWVSTTKKGYIILGFFALFCVFIFVRYVPVVHPEKPLNKMQRRESRKKCGLLGTFYLVILLLTYDVLRIVPYIVLSTMVVTAVLIIVQMRKEENADEATNVKNSSNDW